MHKRRANTDARKVDPLGIDADRRGGLRGCESQVCQCRREGSRPPAVECTNEGIAASCGHCTSRQVNLQHRACKLGLKKLPLQSLRRWNPGHDEARCRRETANEGQPQTTLVLQEGKRMVKAPPRGEHKVNAPPLEGEGMVDMPLQRG